MPKLERKRMSWDSWRQNMIENWSFKKREFYTGEPRMMTGTNMRCKESMASNLTNSKWKLVNSRMMLTILKPRSTNWKLKISSSEWVQETIKEWESLIMSVRCSESNLKKPKEAEARCNPQIPRTWSWETSKSSWLKRNNFNSKEKLTSSIWCLKVMRLKTRS